MTLSDAADTYPDTWVVKGRCGSPLPLCQCILPQDPCWMWLSNQTVAHLPSARCMGHALGATQWHCSTIPVSLTDGHTQYVCLAIPYMF